MRLKVITAGVLMVAAVGGAVYVYMHTRPAPVPAQEPAAPAIMHKVVGHSVEGRAIESYTYGTGPVHILLVGGMHGGYEWNSVALAYQMMDYFEAHPTAIPQNISVTIIPSLNPDGVYKVVGKEGRFSAADATTSANVLAAGRFNAHGVDLNRNFDCKWQPTSTWRGNEVSAGTAAFSEPEAQALRSVVEDVRPSVAVFWHSQANAVYASECHAGILQGTRNAMNAYSAAAGYPAVDTFDAYPVTGDSEGWLASINIPAITVEMSTHDTVEWDKNLAGVQALLTLYSL